MTEAGPRRARTIRSGAILFGVALAATTAGQPAARRATNIAALLAYPGYFHGRSIVLVGTVALEKDRLTVSAEGGSMSLVAKGNAPDGLDEIRGEFWDIGRMKPDDPRLNGYDLRATFRVDPDAPWPRPGDVTAIIATDVTPAQTPPAPSIRAIVLHPSRYLDEQVTVTGQFSGRNLLGELPDAPGQSRYDFVLRSADAAIWVVGKRPRVRDADGKDIELGLDARIDTGRWLEVSGTVREARGLQWIDAGAGTLTLVKPPAETVTLDEPVRVPAGPPPEVIFSAPTEGETDVLTSTNVRIQCSRDLDPKTLKDHVRIGYLNSQSVERGEPDTPAIAFTTQYNAANREVVINFTKPLERFRTVKVEMLDGITGTDGQALKAWTLTFDTGG